MDKNKKEPKRKSTYDKPVSLSGASFNEVVGALLKTPKPTKEDNKSKGKNGG